MDDNNKTTYVGPALSSSRAILAALDVSSLDDMTKKVVLDCLTTQSNDTSSFAPGSRPNRHSIRAARSWLRHARARASLTLAGMTARRARRPGAYQRARPKAVPYVNVRANIREITDRIQAGLEELT